MINQPRRKGLFFGLTTVDIINGIHCHPDPNQKMRADWQEMYAGGPAANGAVAYAAFGNPSHLCSGIGTHPVGQLAVADLAGHHVMLHDHAGDPQRPPVISSILTNATTAERCVVYTDTTAIAPLEDIDEAALLEEVSVLLIDGFFPDQALGLVKTARELHIKTVLDGGSWKDGTLKLLPFIDYAICSDDFSPPGCSCPREVLAFLGDHGISYSAVSRGSQPLVVSDSGALGSIEVPAVGAVDTLGAGDILHGAFCHFIGSASFSESLRLAAAVASASCCHRGTRLWIKKRKPVL
jgi:sugar/nucleoside kinase (ribokinase family)